MFCCCAAVQYPDDEESLAEALDTLLDNPDFLDAVADELVYQVGRGATPTGGQHGRPPARQALANHATWLQCVTP